MLIGKKGYYYLKTILFFAFSKKRSFSISEIAERLDISEKVMEQVLLSLKNAGFLVSKRGPKGGYQLVGDVSNLTVLGVLERTNQKIEIMPVGMEHKKGPIDEVLSEVCSTIEEEICKSLKDYTIKQLKQRMKEKVTETGFHYVI